MKKIEYLPINWVNGLKLNNGHFFETYYNMMETVRLNREEGLTSYNYGFGERLEHASSPIELETKGDTIDTLSIHLKSCNAITRGGFSIIYDQSLYGEFAPSAKIKTPGADLEKEKVIYIILSVSPDKLLPVGVPDPEATPLHHPYALPKICMQLTTETQVNKDFIEGNCIIAGRVIAEGSLFEIDNQYIPATQRVCYDTRLLSFLDKFRKSIDVIHHHSLLICRKNIRDSRRDRLMENTFVLCRSVQRFYDMHAFHLEQLAAEQPPVYMVSLASMFAHSLYTSLRTMPENEAEYLLQYYKEWTNINPADFQQAIGDVKNIRYKHTDILPSLKSASTLMTLLERLFKKMSELEYVGLMRENIVLSEDSTGYSPEEEKKGWRVWE